MSMLNQLWVFKEGHKQARPAWFTAWHMRLFDGLESSDEHVRFEVKKRT